MSNKEKTNLGDRSIRSDFDRFAALDNDPLFAQGMAALQDGIENDGGALKYVSPELRADRDVVLAAIGEPSEPVRVKTVKPFEFGRSHGSN